METFIIPGTITDINEKDVKPANRQKSAAGHTISFSAGTSIKKEIDVGIKNLTTIEKSAVRDFFNTQQGGSFLLPGPDPNDSNTYTMSFNQDEIKWNFDGEFPSKPWGTTLNFVEE